MLQCKSCKRQSAKRYVFSCIEVPVPQREGIANLENCLKKWLAQDEVQVWRSTSCSQCGGSMKKETVMVYIALFSVFDFQSEILISLV